MKEFEIKKERAEKRGETVCIDCSTDIAVMCVNNEQGGRDEIDLHPDTKTPVTKQEQTIEQCRALLGQKVTVFEKL